MRQHLVLAGDVGGTRSRLVAASVGGGLLAQVEGPGANLRSSGPAAFDALAATIAEVLEQARDRGQRTDRHDLGGDVDERRRREDGERPCRAAFTPARARPS